MAPQQIVDTHIHLFRASDLDSLAWMTPDNPLNGPHSVEEYSAAVQSSQASPKYQPTGFVFVETDRRSNVSATTAPRWTAPIQEFAFVHSTAATHPLLGIVAWAPLPAGPAALEKYHEKLQEAVDGKRMDLLKGFRYLLQWVEPGFMLSPALIEGLQWLGSKDLVFDLTVDCRSTGLWQLEEAVEMVRRTQGEVTVVLDHLAKPNLHISPEEVLEHPTFLTWKRLLQEMAGLGRTYIKLSGAFSELPEGLEASPDTLDKIVASAGPWITAAIEAFGPRRALWGSDWPVCTIRAGKEGAWWLWVQVVETVVNKMGLTEEDKEMIFAGTARKVYQTEVGVGKTTVNKSRI